MSIESNVSLILHLLAQEARGKDVTPDYIRQETNLHPDDINDAVGTLRDRGLVEVPPVVAALPYDFGFVCLTTNGRREYEQVLKAKGIQAFPDLTAIKGSAEDKDFETLVKSIRRSIESNEPEEGLDRLHTYLVKYVRSLCERRNIQIDKGTPLHSLLGSYVGALESDGKIEAEVSKRILKCSISVFDAFNDVRNNRSLAHDNQLLNRAESTLIFSHLTSVVRFFRSIEDEHNKNV